MNPDHERMLVKRIKDGECGLYRELVLAYQDKLYSFILRFVENEEDARDICQETFLRGYRHLSGFGFKSKFSTWLFRIAYNSAMSHMKKKSRMREVELVTEVQATQEYHPDSIEKKELSEIISGILSELRKEYRLVITLYYDSDYTYREIADIMGIPINSVKSHLRRGKEEIRVRLRDNYGVEDFID